MIKKEILNEFEHYNGIIDQLLGEYSKKIIYDPVDIDLINYLYHEGFLDVYQIFSYRQRNNKIIDLLTIAFRFYNDDKKKDE